MARFSVCKVRIIDRRGSPVHLLLFGALIGVFLSSHAVVGKQSNLREITDANWEEILQGEWMIEFFAPWCPACKDLQPVWNEFADWGEDMGISIGKVDVTDQPGLSGRFGITSLPTIYHCKDGVFRVYDGARTKDNFFSFINEKKWQDIEPISSWFSPSSLLMHTISLVFRFSVYIREWHSYLTEELGLPAWASYAVFLLATLFTGLLLGLIIVVITDFFWPSHNVSPQHGYYKRKQTLDQARQWKQLEEEDEEDETEDEAGGQIEHRNEGSPRDNLRKRMLGGDEEQEEDCR